MAKYTEEFLRHTIDVWQPMASTRLTESDAEEIADRFEALVELLIQLGKKYVKN